MRNTLRLDLLTPLGLNLGYNLLADRQLLFPVILSYERAVAERWSVNTEIALNGGEPEARRYGGSLSARYYVRPPKKTPSSLASFYLAPGVGFLALRLTDEPPLLVIHAKRLKSGVLIGWQHRLSRGTPRIMLDFAAGATYWAVLGNDRASNPGNNGVSFGMLKPGIRPEARGGIGYQF
ncbi:hypothetical protein [Hymenobacter guriensis]|uniref:DUF3575 domain-containing protein n=1 Tax=Hymenobacter guriensis TaxID=2793065 RepID=A0ABS0KZ21_9BACT|nr:hypothetical protein [Hymenobacter guriensis]MBG8553104.1 hypothetical protein [Hymenobacter guriensis]